MTDSGRDAFEFGGDLVAVEQPGGGELTEVERRPVERVVAGALGGRCQHGQLTMQRGRGVALLAVAGRPWKLRDLDGREVGDAGPVQQLQQPARRWGRGDPTRPAVALEARLSRRFLSVGLCGSSIGCAGPMPRYAEVGADMPGGRPAGGGRGPGRGRVHGCAVTAAPSIEWDRLC